MKRILIVDDDADLATLLAFALERRGYVVELALNGRDGLERVRRTRFDAVIVDWHMPVMDGAAFLRECRRETRTNIPRAVIMSGAPEAASHAQRLGAAAVVAKPFRIEDLEQLLTSLWKPPEGQVGCEP